MAEQGSKNTRGIAGQMAGMSLEEIHKNFQSPLSKLGAVDVFSNEYAEGFTLNLQQGETKFTGKPSPLQQLTIANVFPDTHAIGFTPNVELGESQFLVVKTNGAQGKSIFAP